jgi:hypothetical protein
MGTEKLDIGERVEVAFEGLGVFEGKVIKVSEAGAEVFFECDKTTSTVLVGMHRYRKLASAKAERPAPKRRKAGATTSEFVGVSWYKKYGKWVAQIHHGEKVQNLGYFDDEREAARAVDTAARRLRGEDAHGGRSGKIWHRLNFPTEVEAERAKGRGALLTEEDKAAAAAASQRQGPSKFVGVYWRKESRKWQAILTHDGKRHNLGTTFDDEHEAARAVDTAARRLRGEDAHGGRTGSRWHRLNFPTEGEVKRAKDRGMLTEEDKAAAAAASERQGPSKFVCVSWYKKDRNWKAYIKHDGKSQYLGYFDDEHEAARAVDTAARRLRGEDAHGGRSGKGWHRLNFPTEAEAARAKTLGMLLPEDKAAATAASMRLEQQQGLPTLNVLTAEGLLLTQEEEGQL